MGSMQSYYNLSSKVDQYYDMKPSPSGSHICSTNNKMEVEGSTAWLSSTCSGGAGKFPFLAARLNLLSPEAMLPWQQYSVQMKCKSWLVY